MQKKMPITTTTQNVLDHFTKGGRIENAPVSQNPKPTFGDALNNMLIDSKISDHKIAYCAGIAQSTVSALRSNKRNPSRNTIIRIALALNLSYENTQTLLISAKKAPLSGKDPRDQHIMYAIINNLNITKLEDQLDSANLNLLDIRRDD